MFCIQCGEKLDEKSLYCKVCGKKVGLSKKVQKNGYELAGSDSRLINCILDQIGFYTYIFVLAFALALFGIVFDEDGINAWVISIIGYLSYYSFSEYFWGRTPAKFLTRTKVISETGRKISFAQAFGRTICRMIPFETFSFLGSKPRGWHDKITSTIVIKG